MTSLTYQTEIKYTEFLLLSPLLRFSNLANFIFPEIAFFLGAVQSSLQPLFLPAAGMRQVCHFNKLCSLLNA